MTDSSTISFRMSSLSTIFSTATDRASQAMSKWTNGQISLSIDEMQEVSLESVGSVLQIGDDLLTMVVLTVDGELGGQLILTFDDDNGRKLAATLLGREVCTEPEWTPIEVSALQETGNILGCAYIGELARVIEHNLVPSPPYFMQDYGASVLEQAVMAQAMISERVVIGRTSFQRQGERLNWNVFFVPTEALLKTLEDSFQLTP